MSDYWARALGDKLQSGGQYQVSTAIALQSCTRVGLYFSAHWCPPCRAFTPVLVQFYKAVKGSQFQIIFLSSDRDESGFNTYFASMPWLALPFSQRSTRNVLAGKFGVSGIPFFAVFDMKGVKSTVPGRNVVMRWEQTEQPISDIAALFPLPKPAVSPTPSRKHPPPRATPAEDRSHRSRLEVSPAAAPPDRSVSSHSSRSHKSAADKRKGAADASRSDHHHSYHGSAKSSERPRTEMHHHHHHYDQPSIRKANSAQNLHSHSHTKSNDSRENHRSARRSRSANDIRENTRTLQKSKSAENIKLDYNDFRKLNNPRFDQQSNSTKQPINQPTQKPQTNQIRPKSPANQMAPKPPANQTAPKPPANQTAPRPPANQMAPKSPVGIIPPKSQASSNVGSKLGEQTNEHPEPSISIEDSSNSVNREVAKPASNVSSRSRSKNSSRKEKKDGSHRSNDLSVSQSMDLSSKSASSASKSSKSNATPTVSVSSAEEKSEKKKKAKKKSNKQSKQTKTTTSGEKRLLH